MYKRKKVNKKTLIALVVPIALLVGALYGAGIFDSEEIPLEVVVSTPTPTATAVEFPLPATPTPTETSDARADGIPPYDGAFAYKVEEATYRNLESAVKRHLESGALLIAIGTRPTNPGVLAPVACWDGEQWVDWEKCKPPTETPPEAAGPTLTPSSVVTPTKG